jgi:phosphoribosylglycinamide formyltransferase-1
LDVAQFHLSPCLATASCARDEQVPLSRKIRLGVLGSGKGSNLDALAKYCARPDSSMEIVLVVADVEGAGILKLAETHGLPARYLPPGKFRTKLDEAAESELIGLLREAQIDLVVLAGFMRILKGEFLRAFSEKVINIHPSLLPSFPGLEAWKQALDYGVKVTGCTVHFVDQGIDSGAIIGQQTVPVLENDTAASLHTRIQAAEWALYPRMIEQVALGRVKVEGRHCRMIEGV